MDATKDELLTPKQVAEYLQVPVGTLAIWRMRRTGPAGFKVGKHVRYRKADVETWLAERRLVVLAGAVLFGSVTAAQATPRP